MHQFGNAKAIETPAELAARVGLSVSTVRQLIKSKQLDHIYLSPGQRNPKIPAGSWERYVAARTIRAQFPEAIASETGGK